MSLTKVIVLMLIVLLSARVRVHAQQNQYPFTRIDITQGLSHNQVNTIFKDSKGFMWFGTMSGLNRYDGYKFKVFRHSIHDSSSLSDDYISKIDEGPDNKLWVQSRTFYNIYDPGTEKFDRHPEKILQSWNLPTAGLSVIKKGDKCFWFLYKGIGLYKVGASGKIDSVKEGKGDNAFPDVDINDMEQDSKGNLWLVHQNGLLEKYDAQQNKITARITSLQQENKSAGFLYSMYIDAQDELWLYATGTLPGVYRYTPANNTLQHYSKEIGKGKLDNNIVYAIVQDNVGQIWIGTDHGGVNIINKESGEVKYVTNRQDDDKSICQNSVYSLYKDNTGIVWVGTFKSGISFYHESMVKFPWYKRQSGDAHSLQFNDINRFIEDDKGNIWIGTNGGGLIYFNRKNNTFTQYKHDVANNNSLCNDVIVSMCIDHNKNLWLGTYYGGMDCFDGKTFKHYRHNSAVPSSISDDKVWEIYEDSNNIMWVGTLDGGLNKFDREKNVFKHYAVDIPNTMKANYISSFLEVNKTDLWIGTSYGIDIINRETDVFTHYSAADNNLSNNNVNALLKAKDGHIWVGTREGLNVFDENKKKFQSFRMEDGLPDNIIWNILEDNDGNIWVSTPGGLSKITAKQDPANIFHITCKNYDESDGLQGREFNDNAAYKTRAGELAFGGPGGFNLFDPAEIKNIRQSSPVALTDLQVFNKSILPNENNAGHVILTESISEAKEITLKHNENIFSIEFAALNYAYGEKNKYAYKLEGFNTDWLITEGSNHRVTYTNLDPGKYTFYVKSINDDGTWSKTATTLKITVLPPFWKTPLAYLLYVLAIAGILIFARRIELQRARMKFTIEEERKEVQRMQELDLMKIKFFTNVSHEFRTPLSLIMAPLDKLLKTAHDTSQKNQYQLIQRNARRLLNLVNQLLDFRKLEVQEIKLNASNADIIKFLEEIAYSFTDIAEKKDISFTFNSEIDSLYTAFDADKIERILFNLLSNAFKFTPEHGSISVTVNESNAVSIKGNRLLEIKVQDSGIGIPPEKQEKIFERFFQNDIPGSMLNQGSGIGLSITKEFVKLHNGLITVESEQDKGSCFTVLLPVNELEKPILKPEGPVRENVIMQIENSLLNNEATEEKNGKPSGKKITILLVEDNEDFRFYLKDNLKGHYNIIEAANGKEGWQKALQYHPGLIVSDITMPEMSGIDLCKKIKSDQRTAHTPVILLTARSAQEYQMEGYQTGANDYITKPFNFEILQSRIKNLLQEQEKLRKTYQKQVDVKTTEVIVESADDKFVKQALETVEKNIDNPDFSVEELSRSMYMSRVALYKKLFTLTGKTPIEFIRAIRLQRAAQLLEKSQMTVAEIAYEVGFNNPKYFAKYFKAEYGILPSLYSNERQKLKTEDIKLNA